MSMGSIVYNALDKFAYKISSLLKGKVRVITENQTFPSNTCIGILSSVGLKDERKETLGSCEALSLMQNEHSHLHSNCQLTGGDTSFSFNEETIYSSCSCLQSNAEEMLKGLIDSIYSRKTNSELNILKHKLELNKAMKMIKNPKKSEQEAIMNLMMNRREETTMMPQLNDYIESTLSKAKVIIVASGLDHHDYFVGKVKEYLSQYLKGEEETPKSANKPSRFEYKTLNEYVLTDNSQSSSNIQMIFPSVGWTSPLMPVFAIIAQLFGAAQIFSVGGPGKGIFSRSYVNILSKKSYISSSSCINFHHSAFGVFGLSFGAFDNEAEVIRDMINELHELLKPISGEELTRAKRIIKRKILTNLSSSVSRCEETAKSMFYFDKILHTDFIDLINKVTSEDINNTVKWILDNKENLGLILQAPKNKVQYNIADIRKLL